MSQTGADGFRPGREKALCIDLPTLIGCEVKSTYTMEAEGVKDFCGMGVLRHVYSGWKGGGGGRLKMKILKNAEFQRKFDLI